MRGTGHQTFRLYPQEPTTACSLLHRCDFGYGHEVGVSQRGTLHPHLNRPPVEAWRPDWIRRRTARAPIGAVFEDGIRLRTCEKTSTVRPHRSRRARSPFSNSRSSFANSASRSHRLPVGSIRHVVRSNIRSREKRENGLTWLARTPALGRSCTGCLRSPSRSLLIIVFWRQAQYWNLSWIWNIRGGADLAGGGWRGSSPKRSQRWPVHRCAPSCSSKAIAVSTRVDGVPSWSRCIHPGQTLNGVGRAGPPSCDGGPAHTHWRSLNNWTSCRI